MICELFGELIIILRFFLLLKIIVGFIVLCGCFLGLILFGIGKWFLVGENEKLVSWLFNKKFFIIMFELNINLILVVIDIVFFFLFIIEKCEVLGSFIDVFMVILVLLYGFLVFVLCYGLLVLIFLVCLVK